MNIMIKSPLQPNDYVRRGEFNEFKEFVTDGFDRLGEQINTVETNLGNKITRLEKRFDGLENRFDGLEKRFDKLEEQVGLSESRIIMEFNKVAAIQLEHTAHMMKSALELVPGVDGDSLDGVFEKYLNK